jgi:hypothetical protein
MIDLIFLYLGAGLTTLWGVAHLFPTTSVVDGFGDISRDNRHIITMEWVVEGVALIFIGILLAVVTFMDPASSISRAVYLLCSVALIVLALVSLFTGFRVSFLPFKLCPLIFTVSAILVFFGGVF